MYVVTARSLRLLRSRERRSEVYLAGVVAGETAIRTAIAPHVKRGEIHRLDAVLYRGTGEPACTAVLQVWESDGGRRAVGNRLDRLNGVLGSSLVDQVAAASGATAVVAAVQRVARALAAFLRQDGDDLLFEQTIRVDAATLHALVGRSMKYGNKRAEIEIAVTMADPGPAAPAEEER